MIEKLDRKVTIYISTGTTVDIYGGVSESVASNPVLIYYTMWGEVQDRSGFPVLNEQQQIWNYDIRVKVRYEASRIIKSNYRLGYEGFKYAIKEVSTQNEGKKRFVILRCQKTDEVIYPG